MRDGIGDIGQDLLPGSGLPHSSLPF